MCVYIECCIFQQLTIDSVFGAVYRHCSPMNFQTFRNRDLHLFHFNLDKSACEVYEIFENAFNDDAMSGT